MWQKTPEELRQALAAPFSNGDIEWRVSATTQDKSKGLAVPYVTNRAIQNRLDSTVGIDGWQNEFRPWKDGKAQLCGISIYFHEQKQWLTKWDGADDSDFESVKGGLSDSMKRAAVQWGIGRVLYSMTDPVWVDIEPRGRSWAIQKKERPVMDSAYLSLLNTLKLQPAAPIGTQSQLTPAETGAANAGPAPQQAAGKPAPVCDCIVRGAALQKGMNGSSTVVSLEYPGKKLVSAYARGEHPQLVPGVMLSGVKLVKRQQDTVVFYVLEAYQIVSVQQAA